MSETRLQYLSSTLYLEEALIEQREENIGALKVNGILVVQMLRFADDIAMLADSKALDRTSGKLRCVL